MFSLIFSRRRCISKSMLAVGALLSLDDSWASEVEEDGLSHDAEAIHQEPVFKASPKRLYDALLDARQFQKIELLGSAMKASDLQAMPAQISNEVGGAFSIFAGFITGRQLELVPNQRIVQSWRETSWPAGIHSIVKFEITAQEPGSKIQFDHTGFPAGAGPHLASGWKANYWDTMNKFFA